MTRASRSRQLRRFTTTLAPQVVDAMQVIVKEYRPGEPLTKHTAQGILNDAVLLWSEMIIQKKTKEKEQAAPNLDDNPEVQQLEQGDDTTGGESVGADSDKERSGETADGSATDASTDEDS